MFKIRIFRSYSRWSFFNDFFYSLTLTLFLFVSVNASEIKLPWLKNINAADAVNNIHTISAEASVIVSDGLTFKTNSVFHDRQRSVYHRVYEDKIIGVGVEGKYVWINDGSSETEADPAFEEFVTGHQFHAHILFFDKIYPEAGEIQPAKFNGTDCFSITAETGNSSMTLYYNEEGYPLGMEKRDMENSIISFKFNDWKKADNILLPYDILIDDGKRKFQYQFNEISINKGSISEYRAPEKSLSEEQKVLRLHRIFMDGHFFGDTKEMNSLNSDSVIIVSRGEVYNMTREEANSSMDRIINSRDYKVYDDLARPLVRISNDGTLAWLIAKVYAKGNRFDTDGKTGDEVEFTCAWIELYKKRNGKWYFTGNVSNFQ